MNMEELLISPPFENLYRFGPFGGKFVSNWVSEKLAAIICVKHDDLRLEVFFDEWFKGDESVPNLRFLFEGTKPGIVCKVVNKDKVTLENIDRE